jgi:hypothetical protein
VALPPDSSAMLAARATRAVPMSRALRTAILGTGTLLWLSGAVWLLLHFAFPAHNEFGPLPNPWEASLMRLHGLIAVAGVFLCGWIGAGHILTRWSCAANRVSGLTLMGCAIVLVGSGYALYYSSGAVHEGAGAVHEWLGLLAIIAALTHWLRSGAVR